MSTSTLSIKVSSAFAARYRAFCDANYLQVGKLAEGALLEVMEDYHFGRKAQAVLSQAEGKRVSHAKLKAKQR